MDHFAPTHVLVTGAAGMTGRALVRRLAGQGVRVRAVDLLPSQPAGDHAESQPVEPRTADLLAPSACDEAVAGVQAIVHCAARQYHSGLPRVGRDAFFHANVDMFDHLLQAARRHAVEHVVFLSSDFVYGLPIGRPLREDDALRPIGPYGHSKVACETLARRAAAGGLPVTILRPRFIVGPGRLGVLRRVFEAIRSGGKLTLIGDGSNRYQMVSVADVVEACVAALARRPVTTINLGSENPPTLRALFDEIARRANARIAIRTTPAALVESALTWLDSLRIGPLAPEQFRLAAHTCLVDITRAADRLGWRPRDNDVDAVWAAYQDWAGLAPNAAPTSPPAAVVAHRTRIADELVASPAEPVKVAPVSGGPGIG